MLSTTTAQKSEIPPLTGIRGIAACWVVLYHVHEFDNLPLGLASVLRHGYLAVDVFFVLSGFIMALNYAKFFITGFRWLKHAEFLMRRAGRIYPLYLLMTLMLFADDFLHSRADTHWLSMAKNLALNLLLIQSWGFGSPIDGPAWSISTEFAAYLLFPVLLAATVYRPLRYALMVGIMCFFAVGAISLLPTPASYQFPRMGPLDISWQHSPWPMVRCLLEFSVGLVAYRIDQETEIGATLAQPVNAAIIGFAMLLALFIPRGDMLFFAAIPALLLSLAHSRNFAAHFFGSRSAVFLGDISFAVYLLHWALLPIRERLGPVFGDAGALAIFYVSLIVGAWGLYITIEKPCRDGVRKFERRILRPQDRATLPQM